MYKTLWLLVIKVGEKWCQATKTWKFWLSFLAKSLFFSRYPRFSPFKRPDAYRCYTFSESCGSRETRDIKSSTSKFDIEAGGILSSLWTQTGPWSDTASYVSLLVFFKFFKSTGLSSVLLLFQPWAQPTTVRYVHEPLDVNGHDEPVDDQPPSVDQ